MFQRTISQIFITMTSTKRCLTDEMEEAVSNSELDLFSEDELLSALNDITIDSGDEDLLEGYQWHSGIFSPIISQLISEPGLQNTIPLVGKTPLDYFQLFFG